MIPQSTTPSWTYSGMSAARTSRTSTGAFRQGKASARSPGCSGPSPASSSSETDGSRRRPLTGTAIFSRSMSPPPSGRAPSGSRPRRGGASARPASPSSSRRASCCATSRYGQPPVDEPRHRPAVRHRLELRDRAQVAEEPLHLVPRLQRQDRLRQLSQLSRPPCVSSRLRHVDFALFMLAR